MKPLLHPFLINGPFDDPGLYVEIKWDRRALLFDAGDVSHLNSSQLLKVSDVFISHMHMDHFIGFDNILRTVLGREKIMRIFGPPGMTDCIEGKLKGYTWNLTGNYPFILKVTELNDSVLNITEFHAADGFVRRDSGSKTFTGSILEEDMFSVYCSPLDHKIPSLAFALKERFHININSDRLSYLGLPVGPWLRTFKQALWEGAEDDESFLIVWGDDPESRKELPIGILKDEIATITAGQKLSYIVDAVYSDKNAAVIEVLAKDSDIMFCEAAYLERDRDIASERFHLTAHQAGELARRAGVKSLEIFHFSPRYRDNPAELFTEAMNAFRGIP